MTVLPTFFIIGAAKAGTTSLSDLLSLHPEVGIVRGKEPHFFSAPNSVFNSGWKHYGSLFDHCRSKRAIGDSSTSYSRIRYYPAVADRIRKYVPQAKILYMVRHPLERMESAYVEHLCTPGFPIVDSVSEAVRHRPMIIDSSRYWEVYEAYSSRFGETQVMVVWFEEYIAEPAATFYDVCRFLEIDASVVPQIGNERKNSRHDAIQRLRNLGRAEVLLNTSWEEPTRAWVVDQIHEDTRRFLGHFGRPLSYWKNLY